MQLALQLKLFPVDEDLQIAAFILYGDVEITEHAARELLAGAPDHDIMITAASALLLRPFVQLHCNADRLVSIHQHF